MAVLVSWLIPNYRSNPIWLQQTLESCISGGIKDQEIIISCDGEVENNAEIAVLKTWSNKAKILHYRINRGVEYALNSAIDVAEGRYYARIDTDDYSEPNRIEKQIKFLEENKLDACGSWLQVVDGEILKPPEPEDRREMLFKSRPPIFHPTTLFRASSVKKLGSPYYLTGYRYAEDLAFWIRAYNRRWQLDNVGETLVNYRVHYWNTGTQFPFAQRESAKKAIHDWPR